MSNLYVIDKKIVNEGALKAHYEGCYAIAEVNDKPEIQYVVSIEGVIHCTDYTGFTRSYYTDEVQFVTIKSGWVEINESNRAYLNKRYISDVAITRKRGLHRDNLIVFARDGITPFSKLEWVKAANKRTKYVSFEDGLNDLREEKCNTSILSNELAMFKSYGTPVIALMFKDQRIGYMLKSGKFRLRNNNFIPLLSHFNIPLARPLKRG